MGRSPPIQKLPSHSSLAANLENGKIYLSYSYNDIILRTLATRESSGMQTPEGINLEVVKSAVNRSPQLTSAVRCKRGVSPHAIRKSQD